MQKKERKQETNVVQKNQMLSNTNIKTGGESEG